MSSLVRNRGETANRIYAYGMLLTASLLSHLSGKTLQKMDPNQSNLTTTRNSVLAKLAKTSLKFTKPATLLRRRWKFDRSCHLFQKLMGRCNRIIESTIANLMASFSVQCQQKQKDLQLLHSISWPGKMVKCSQR